MMYLQVYLKEITAVLVPLIVFFLNTKFKPKAQLKFGVLHQFTFLVQQPLYDENGVLLSPTQTAHTQSLIIKNTGKECANNIEIVLNWQTIINIWPIRSYSESLDKDGRFILIFSSLSPDEELKIELLSINKDLPSVITVRSDDCISENVTFNYYQTIPLWRIRVIRILFGIGFIASFYLLITFIQFLIVRTPTVL